MTSKSTSRIHKELEKLVAGYFNECEAADFYRQLMQEGDSTKKNEISVNMADQVQLNFKIPLGLNERDVVNRIITFSKPKLELEKYIELLLTLSQILTFNGEISVASELCEEIINKCEGKNNLLKLEAEAHLSLARLAWMQAFWEQSFNEVNYAQGIFSKIEDSAGLAKCENMLATIFGEKGDIQEALFHLEKGLTFLKNDQNYELKAMFEANLGILYCIKNDFGKALWNLNNALENFIKLNDMRRAARVRHNLAMLYSKKEDYQAALEEFNKSIAVSIDFGYLSNLAVGYIGKAYIYTKLNNSALAEVFTDKALEIACKINDTLSIADIYKIKGMIQNNLENFDLSEEMFENSIRLNEDLGSILNKNESIDELNKLYERQKQIK